ncbi:MAG: hypothetical protein ABW298_07110 [Candidatus Binatia bacterium]
MTTRAPQSAKMLPPEGLATPKRELEDMHSLSQTEDRELPARGV